MKKQKLGRKTNEENHRKRCNVMMSEDTIKRLKVLGNGNISEGIRAAAMGRRTPYAER